MSKHMSSIMLAVLLLSSFIAFLPLPAAQAVPAATLFTNKVIAEVQYPVFVSGTGFVPGGALWFQVASSGTGFPSLSEGEVHIGAPEGSVQTKAGTGGLVPAGAFIKQFGADAGFFWTADKVGADSIGIAQTVFPGSAADVTFVEITVVDTGPTIDLVDPSLFVDLASVAFADTITIEGSGFSAGGTVHVYWNDPSRTVATVTADSSGAISVDVDVPESPSGYQALYVHDAGMNLFAINDHDGTGEAWIDVFVEPSLETDKLSLRGTAGESFSITAHGIAELTTASPADVAYRGAKVAANSIQVDAVSTTHDQVTASTLGRLTVAVNLGATIGATGFVPVTMWYGFNSPAFNDGAQSPVIGEIVVSNPAVIGDEILDVSPGSRFVGLGFTVTLINWPASAAVALTQGESSLGSITTDANGAGQASFTVPETFGNGYAYHIYGRSGGLLAFDTLVVNARVRLYDASGNRITASTYVDIEASITIRATGLGPRTAYEITENGANIVDEDVIESVAKGTVLAATSQVRSTEKGSIELTYTTFSSTTTGTVIMVEFTPVPTGVVDAEFLMAGTVSFLINGATFASGVTGTSPVVTIDASGLVPTRRYSMLFDGAVVGAMYAAVTRNTWLGTQEPFTVKIPASTEGRHTLQIVLAGTTSALRTRSFIFSTPGGSAAISLSTATGVAGLTDAPGRLVTVRGYNFRASEADAALKVAGTAGIGVPSVPIAPDANGAFEASMAAWKLPGGDYLIFVDRTSGAEPSAAFSLRPQRVYATPSIGILGTVVRTVMYGLQADTRYYLLFGIDTATKTGGTVVARFTTCEHGHLAVTFTLGAAALVQEGTYFLGVALASNPSAVVATYRSDTGAESYRAFTVEAGNLELTPNPEAFPTQVIQFTWSGAGLPEGGVSALLLVDDQPLAPGFTIALSDGTDVTGSFALPNGASDTLVKIALATEGGMSDPAVIKRISGAGAFLAGADITADLATIKTGVSTIQTSLTELGAKITSISNGVATLDTKFGTMTTSLSALDAKVVAVQGGIATLSTNLGTVTTNLGNLQTAVTGLKTDISGVKSDLSAAVSGVKSDVSSVKSDVATLKSDLAGVTSGVGNTTTYVLVVAALAAITLVLQLATLIRKLD